jgi:hypothetical protein
VTYKETHANAKIDPLPDVWTGTWRDARSYNPEGPKPENALTGTIFTVNAWRNDPLIVPASYGKLRFWRNTGVAKLQPGERAVLGSGILGHEWNEDLDNGFRPAGLIRMSETTVNNVLYIQDHGTLYDSGTATHHLTLYRAPSGALVFSAGTVQWAWGLDAFHDTETGIPPERAVPNGAIRIGVDLKGPVRDIRQATVNLFADMGVQPATLQPGLVRAQPSTDAIAPVSKIASPVRVMGDTMVLSGTASDSGGGVVAGVEVSLDGGRRWHPAVGTTSWRFEGQAPGTAGNLRVVSRAVDDSGNLETPPSTTPLTAAAPGR